MAINLDAIKAKLQQMQQANTGGGGNKASEHMWKPPVGKSQIRIVPYAHNKDNPFIELYFHYEIGKRTMVSPMSFGRPDPIVEFAEKLKKSWGGWQKECYYRATRNASGQLFPGVDQAYKFCLSLQPAQ